MYQRNIHWLPPVCTPTGDHTCNLGMCPDRESNLQRFGISNDTPTNLNHTARAIFIFCINYLQSYFTCRVKK